MTKNKVRNISFGLLTLLTLPFAVSAQTSGTSDTNAQIHALIMQVTALQLQLQNGQVSNTSAAFTRNLTVGSKGSDVMALQTKLIQKGFLMNTTATGFFGDLTKSAVARWQASKKISPISGYFGPLSRAAFMAEVASDPTLVVTSTPATTANPTIIPTTPTVQTPIVVSRPEVTGPPTITNLSPGTGKWTTVVTVIGTNFTPTNNRIKFGNTNSENNPGYSVNSTDGTTLTFNVPKYPYVGCANPGPNCTYYSGSGLSGTFDVSVITSKGTSNTATFIMTPTESPGL